MSEWKERKILTPIWREDWAAADLLLLNVTVFKSAAAHASAWTKPNIFVFYKSNFTPTNQQ